MTVGRMHIACWMTKATNTHSEYVILIAFPLQQWLHERASMLRYTYIACLALPIVQNGPASQPASGSAVDHTPPSRAAVQNWVELHLYLPLYTEGGKRKNCCPPSSCLPLLCLWHWEVISLTLTVTVVPTCKIENTGNTTNNCSGI